MGRKAKQGLSYFPLDVELDDKFDFIEAKHGNEGFAVAIKLLQHIYKNGYWVQMDDRKLTLFCKKYVNNIDIDVCKNVINDCINEGLFNKNLYNAYNILTSRGIQKVFFEISKRRRGLEIVPEFLLVEVNADINAINVDINSLNVCKSTQTETETETETKDMSDSKESRPRTSSYSKEFEQLWQRDWFGEKGSKKEAYQEYKKLKPDTELLQTMTDAIDNQVAYKKQKQKIPPDYFAENMPHVCRWIKKERWTDELPELKYTNGKYEPKRLTFVDKAAYDKFINDPENQKKIKSGEIEVKFQKESYV